MSRKSVAVQAQSRKWLPPLIVLMVMCCVAGLIALPDWGGDLNRAFARQVDSENSALCEKFGFPANTPDNADCKFQLSELRRRDGELRALYTIP